ncbi:OLC1v1024952C1 [Oldenlandia corymbosa var. corymbosa]|uniref:OLC1v1024952C1 n=1 Tax=Oldenlandia corymbosa var. corymbosa TaxID=529605 RepID=A0AAV1C3N1_OLDCO|nr:OLC1v1024952C1 [Oldenlandia corymbosa var. corymbosa]
MAQKAWKIIPRPLLETILNSHVQQHRVPQPLILHGPRGVGKTTLILERLLDRWNTEPHFTAYVDLAESIQDHHPKHEGTFPWASWSNCSPPPLSSLRVQLENSLEELTVKGIMMGKINSRQIFTTLNKWHNPTTAVERICGIKDDTSMMISSTSEGSKRRKKKVSAVAAALKQLSLWDMAVCRHSVRLNAKKSSGRDVTPGEHSYYGEAMAALDLAKEVIRVQQGWRVNAIKHLNATGGFSRPLAHSSTDWPCLLLELLSDAAEVDYFQPKLVINNIDILKNAILTDDTSVNASMYHDSLIWRMIALCVNERCLPVILVTSDSYYSYRAFIDFGFPDIFISRETFGWTPAEAKMHMVDDYFSPSEWNLLVEALGPNPRHLFEVYALKLNNYYNKFVGDKGNTIEDLLDAYLAYLQVTVVNPAMDRALLLLQNFAMDARNGKISKDRLRFGAPWRHPPQTDNPSECHEWAKVQLMDFVQSLVNTEFGVNYFADWSLEIFDDPSTVALLEVGLLYVQRDPSFIRPITRGVQRCLVRWLVQEQMQMNSKESIQYLWQRSIRGRSYRHLMLEVR